MDTEHVRSGAALEGRPAYRYNPGGQVFRGSTERLPRLPPTSGFAANDPELASYLRIEERELEAAPDELIR
jgi:hypothetical protein